MLESQEIIKQHERSLILTLHVSVCEPGTSFVFSCTNIGDDELASGVAELRQSVASLYTMIASELQGECFRLILPDGHRLNNNVQMLCDALGPRS